MSLGCYQVIRDPYTCFRHRKPSLEETIALFRMKEEDEGGDVKPTAVPGHEAARARTSMQDLCFAPSHIVVGRTVISDQAEESNVNPKHAKEMFFLNIRMKNVCRFSLSAGKIAFMTVPAEHFR